MKHDENKSVSTFPTDRKRLFKKKQKGERRGRRQEEATKVFQKCSILVGEISCGYMLTAKNMRRGKMFVENVFEECLTFFQKVDKVSSLEYWFWKRGTTRTTSIEHVPPTSFGFVACGAKMEPQRRQTWASCSSLHLNRRSCNRKEVPCANLFVCPQRKKKTKSEWCVFLSRQK